MTDADELKLCQEILNELNEILEDDWIAEESHIQHIISSHSDCIEENYKHLGKRLAQVSKSVQKYNDFILKKNGIE